MLQSGFATETEKPRFISAPGTDIFHLLLHKRKQVIPLSRYGHSKVLKLLEHHLEKAGDIKGMDAADGRLHLKLRRT